MDYLEQVEQVWEGIARWVATADDRKLQQGFTADDIARQLGTRADQFNAEYDMISSVFGSLKELGLIIALDTYQSPYSTYSVQLLGENHLNKRVGTYSESLVSRISLAEDVTRFLQVTITMSCQLRDSWIQLEDVESEKVLQELGWFGTTDTPAHLERIMRTLEHYELVDIVSKGSPLDFTSGLHYEFVPTYQGMLWAARHSKSGV